MGHQKANGVARVSSAGGLSQSHERDPNLEYSSTQRIFFSVGEPSGDLHASKLIKALRAELPQFAMEGLGGPLMRDSGCRLHYELTNLAVVGIAEVLPKLREFFRVADLAEAEFRRGNVSAVVLVDFPGFNWHIAKRAKKYGIPVFYYLPPQLWAWASWRVSKMRRWVDHVLCNLPFEAAWYQARGIKVHDVGHPFFDEVADRKLDPDFMAKHGSCPSQLVGVLPGSRGHEVTRNWPVQLEVIRRLYRDFPDTRFLVAGYKAQQLDWCREQLQTSDVNLPIDFYVGKTSEIIEVADVAMMVSGSVSLEVMARRTPAVVQYRPTRLTCWLGKSLANCKYISLPNLIANKEIMKEFIHTGSIESAANDIDREMRILLSNAEERQRVEKELRHLTDRCAQPGATVRAAQTIVELLAVQTQKSNSMRAA
jgi:lipid-A-disaccharide synthase